MNVTQSENKHRKLHKEDCLQKVPAEQGIHAEVGASYGITENNVANADTMKDGLLEKILDRNNLNLAFKKVKSNKGAGGIDEMSVDELLPYLKENNQSLVRSIRDGKYLPQPVRRVEIPKEEKGKMRKLGIPTVVDRVVQQVIALVLTPIFEEQFSDNSFGFRPKRSAHDAIRRCQRFVDEGYKYVVDMDLEKYFDTVNQSNLVEVLSRTIKDGRARVSVVRRNLKEAGGKVPGRRTEISYKAEQGRTSLHHKTKSNATRTPHGK